MSIIEPNKIFVKFMPKDTTNGKMKAFFSQCGKVVNVRLVKPKFDETVYIYGFITYETQAEADRAVVELNDTQMKPGFPQKLSVVHSLVPEARKEQDNFKEAEKNIRAFKRDYQELRQICQANAKKISQIYNKPEEEKEIEELLSKKRTLKDKQDQLKIINNALKDEIDVLRLKVKIKNLEIENTKLKEAQ